MLVRGGARLLALERSDSAIGGRAELPRSRLEPRGQVHVRRQVRGIDLEFRPHSIASQTRRHQRFSEIGHRDSRLESMERDPC